MTVNAFSVGPVEVGGGELFLIGGPCVIESETHARALAEAIVAVTRELGMPYIFKASYDKANRTSLHSFRGPGLMEGARILRAIAQDTGLPVLTDVHTPDDCARLSDAVGDVELMLQIPAFLCRQTDLLIAAAQTGRAINVKKGQFVAPLDMRHAVEKVRESGNDRVSLCERGASFGYNNLVVDMRGLPLMRAFAPVVFDGNAFGANAFGGQGRLGRTAGIYPGAGAGSSGRRSGWSVSGSARQSRGGKVRRRQCSAVTPVEEGSGAVATGASGCCAGLIS